MDSYTLLNPADRNLPFMPFDSKNLVRISCRYGFSSLRLNTYGANRLTRI